MTHSDLDQSHEPAIRKVRKTEGRAAILDLETAQNVIEARLYCIVRWELHYNFHSLMKGACIRRNRLVCPIPSPSQN